ncbi:hypothetical protein N2152v2_001588 [Parachlorella kessleri]
MALMKAFTTGIRALAPYSSSKLLGNASRAIATSSWTGNSAAQAAQDENEPETTGWGQKDDSGAWLWCSRDDWVIDAIRKMTHANVGSLVVFDASKVTVDRAASKVINATQDAVVGIFTERDYMTKIIVKGKNSSSTKVSEVMTPAEKLVTVTPKHSVLDVMSLMVEKNLRHVPVVDAGALAGMVSIKDVVQVMLKEHRWAQLSHSCNLPPVLGVNIWMEHGRWLSAAEQRSAVHGFRQPVWVGTVCKRTRCAVQKQQQQRETGAHVVATMGSL